MSLGTAIPIGLPGGGRQSRPRSSCGRWFTVCAALLVAAMTQGCGAGLNSQLESGVPLSETRGELPGSSAFKAAPVPGGGAAPTPGLGAKTATGTLQAPSQAAQLIYAATPGDASYKVGPLDVIEVNVFKVPELSKTVQVTEGGTINMPLIGETAVAGRTAQEIEFDLARRLGAKYLQSPQVNIIVREFNSQRVTLEGAARKPGIYPLKGKTTLLQLMAMADGINTEIANNEVVVFRTRDGKRYAAKFDVNEIRTGNAEDPQVLAGDVIVVHTSDVKSAFNGFMKALPLAGFLMLAL